MTAVADTRLLLTLQFPPTKELKARIEETITRELAGRLVAPSVVSTEFLKIAGARIGESAAELRLNLLKERGMKVIPITEEMALIAPPDFASYFEELSKILSEPGSSAKRKESELDEKYGLTNHPEWLPELVREYKLKNPLS